MIRILFWNLAAKDLRGLVIEAVKSSLTDVVILIESAETSTRVLKQLQVDISNNFHQPLCALSRFQLFCRDKNLDLSEVYNGRRVSIRRLAFDEVELILAIVHVVDKNNWDPLNQSTQISLLAEEIRQVESKRQHDRTFVIGDFNMNPFDQSMNMAPGLNAMMTKKCVERGTRTLQDINYKFFYNPMWSLFGDHTPGPAGTFYHTSSSKGHYGWNMLDQVLIRPSALQWFGDVRIITEAGENLLHTKSGRPNKTAASDHFPLLLTLEKRAK